MEKITNDTYFVIGLMSGTSLDGIDLAYVKFEYSDSWKFELMATTTKAYDITWQNRLKNAHLLDSNSLLKLDIDYTQILSQVIVDFISDFSIERLDMVCSHGHTILHNPNEGITYQAGNRSELAKNIGHTVVCDFRKQDVALGGQGAPLVPIGDQLLFGKFSACLNLGGFANTSMSQNQKLIAFDLCPVNTVLNRLVAKVNLEYDAGGALARKGKLIPTLYECLNRLDYYNQQPPKSLGIEWVSNFILPEIDRFSDHSLNDLLHTYTEHAAHQIGNYFLAGQNVLVSGGGCFNDYLMERIQKKSEANFSIPEEDIINYKEALVFGFLGVLRWRNEVNCLASVTGSKKNHCTGLIFYS